MAKLGFVGFHKDEKPFDFVRLHGSDQREDFFGGHAIFGAKAGTGATRDGGAPGGATG